MKSGIKNKPVKSVGVDYIIKVNGQPVYNAETRKAANSYLKTMTLNEAVHNVSIVRRNVTEVTVKVLVPEIQRVLTVSELDFD